MGNIMKEEHMKITNEMIKKLALRVDAKSVSDIRACYVALRFGIDDTIDYQEIISRSGTDDKTWFKVGKYAQKNRKRWQKIYDEMKEIWA